MRVIVIFERARVTQSSVFPSRGGRISQHIIINDDSVIVFTDYAAIFTDSLRHRLCLSVTSLLLITNVMVDNRTAVLDNNVA